MSGVCVAVVWYVLKNLGLFMVFVTLSLRICHSLFSGRVC